MNQCPAPFQFFFFFGDVQRQPVVVLAMTYIVQTTNSRYLSSTSCRAVFSARSSGKTTASVRLIVHMHMLVPVKASNRVRVLDHRSGRGSPAPYPTLPCSKAARPNKLLEWRRTNKGVLVHACQKLRLHMHACMHAWQRIRFRIQTHKSSSKLDRRPIELRGVMGRFPPSLHDRDFVDLFLKPTDRRYCVALTFASPAGQARKEQQLGCRGSCTWYGSLKPAELNGS